MGVKTGLDGKLYASTTEHSAGTPTFTLIDLVESIDHEHSADEIELVNRRGRHKKYAAGKIAKSYTVRVTYDPADAGFIILYDAFISGAAIGVAIMDDLITVNGTKGWYADMVVMQGPKPEDLTGFDAVEFVLRPAAKSSYEPTRTTISV